MSAMTSLLLLILIRLIDLMLLICVAWGHSWQENISIMLCKISFIYFSIMVPLHFEIFVRYLYNIEIPPCLCFESLLEWYNWVISFYCENIITFIIMIMFSLPLWTIWFTLYKKHVIDIQSLIVLTWQYLFLWKRKAYIVLWKRL